MKDITKNEMAFVLTLLKNPDIDYNANSISKELGISSMGALKIAKSLEKEEILLSKEMGRARFYRINFQNDYAKQSIILFLKREAESSAPAVKRWISEIKKIKNAEMAILFGSVLRNEKDAKDIDILLVSDEKSFPKLKKAIDEINLINPKKLHPVYQTEEDLKNNISKEDKVILNAVKGIIVFGEDILLNVLSK